MTITEQIQAAQDSINTACEGAKSLIQANQDAANAALAAMKAQMEKVAVDFPAAVTPQK